LEKVTGNELGKQGTALRDSLARRAMGEQQIASARQKMPRPPGRVGRWGGTVMTERDAAYCGCGHLKAEHPCLKKDGCCCEREYEEGGVP
jgi:hypothetical protein